MSDLYQVYYGITIGASYIKEKEMDPIGRPMSLEDARHYMHKRLYQHLVEIWGDDGEEVKEIYDVVMRNGSYHTDSYNIAAGSDYAHIWADWEDLSGTDAGEERYFYKILPYQEPDGTVPNISIKDWIPGHTMIEILIRGGREELQAAKEILEERSHDAALEAKLLYPLERILNDPKADMPTVVSCKEQEWMDAPAEYEGRIGELCEAVSVIKERVTNLEAAARILYPHMEQEEAVDLFCYFPKGAEFDLECGFDLECESEKNKADIRNYLDVSWIPQIWKDEAPK